MYPFYIPEIEVDCKDLAKVYKNQIKNATIKNLKYLE